MTRLGAAALVITWLVVGAGESRAQAVITGEPDSPAHCTSYSTGGDTHTTCAPGAPAPPGAALACHSYAVGSDPYTECAPVAQPGLGGPGKKKPLPIPPPASGLRCYTYHIGASAYTDCR